MPFETIVIKGTSNGYEDSGEIWGVRTSDDVATDLTAAYEKMRAKAGQLQGIIRLAQPSVSRDGPDLLFTYKY